MVADVFEYVCERGEFTPVQVLDEVFLDAAPVYGSGCAQSLESCGGDQDFDDAAVVGWALAPYEPCLLHAVDHPGQPALTEQDPPRELVHAQAVFCLFEVDERVVPTERDPALGVATRRRGCRSARTRS